MPLPAPLEETVYQLLTKTLGAVCVEELTIPISNCTVPPETEVRTYSKLM